jgi:hypothetical protein
LLELNILVLRKLSKEIFAGFNRYLGKEPPTGFSKTPTAAKALSAVCLNKKAHPINQMSFFNILKNISGLYI